MLTACLVAAATDPELRRPSFGAPSLVCEGCSWADDFTAVPRTGSSRPPVLLGSARGGAWFSTSSGRSWSNYTPGVPPMHLASTAAAPSATLHDFGASAAFAAPATAYSRFSSKTCYAIAADEGGNVTIAEQPTPVSFELNFSVACNNQSHYGGWPTACPFWGGGSGGNVLLRDGRTLQTVTVPWLGGSEGAAKEDAGLYAFVSMDTLRWKQHSRIATMAQFPWSGEGPNENDIARLSNGSLLVVFRIEGGDGGLWVKPGPCPKWPNSPGCAYRNYQRVVSTNEGSDWGAPVEIANAGCARPRLLALHGGALLLSGGRFLHSH